MAELTDAQLDALASVARDTWSAWVPDDAIMAPPEGWRAVVRTVVAQIDEDARLYKTEAEVKLEEARDA